MENIYFVNLDAKHIHVPNSRWYEIGNYLENGKAYVGVTSVLGVKAKTGLLNWQIQIAKSGVDPKEIGKQAMAEGSVVHNACESLMLGNELTYSEEEYDFYGSWLPICRFKEAYHELEIKPVLIEQVVFSNRMEVAGTLDQLSFIKPKGLKNHSLALIDLKRGSSAYVDYQWQLAAYKECLLEMVSNPEKDSEKLVAYLMKEMSLGIEDLIEAITNVKCYLLLLNTPTKKGWRLTEVTDTSEKLKGFEACNNLFKIENPNLNYVRETYPIELNLGIESKELEL